MKIKTGTVLRLHGAGAYKIGEFAFEINPETGNIWGYVELTSIESDEKKPYPISVIQSLLQTAQLYEIGREAEMDRYHDAIRRGVGRASLIALAEKREVLWNAQILKANNQGIMEFQRHVVQIKAKTEREAVFRALCAYFGNPVGDPEEGYQHSGLVHEPAYNAYWYESSKLRISVRRSSHDCVDQERGPERPTSQGDRDSRANPNDGSNVSPSQDGR